MPVLRFFKTKKRKSKSRRTKKGGKIEWLKAPDVKKRVNFLLRAIRIDWVNPYNIVCFRSNNANTRAYARIWGLGKIWQQALDLEPHYVIEVISEKYDKLPQTEQDKILLHEITHIPKNFSGSLVPHIRRGKRNFHDQVDRLVDQYFKSLKNK